MIYRTNSKNGDQISQLGFGCMRFPKNIEQTTELVKSAIERGVNYFDTAYIYPGSEQALGTVLHNTGLRHKIKIATKLPLFLCKTNQSLDKLFNTQLERLNTDYVDYYFLHMLSNTQTFDRLKDIGILEWIADKKKKGAIINMGFSFHGQREDFVKLIDAYDWDFCQIQYNYRDENKQAGRFGLDYASQKGVPIIVMSPLRGGLLSNTLPEAAKKLFAKANNTRSLTEWSLRWIWDQPEVLTVLSGMGEAKYLDENIAIASTVSTGNVTNQEREIYKQVIEAFKQSDEIPCTGCGYCLPCPQGVNIPDCFFCYNESRIGPFFEAVKQYLMSTGAVSTTQHYASKCTKCKVCEKHCPQQIQISQELTKVSKRMESFWFRPVFAMVRKVLRIK